MIKYVSDLELHTIKYDFIPAIMGKHMIYEGSMNNVTSNGGGI